MNIGMNTKLLMTTLLLSLVLFHNQATADSKQGKLAKQARLAEKYQYNATESISQVMQFDLENPKMQGVDNQITIFNVYGSIEVEGYVGDEVSIEATNQVFADSQGLVDEGLQEIGLKFKQHGQHIMVYLDSPFTYVDKESGQIWHSDSCWRHDDCSRKHKQRKAYKYHMDITVKIPQNTNIKVSTINNGDISITGIDAQTLNVNNINGAINMVDVAGQTTVNAINKDINISYRNNPTADSSFESINGDLNISFAGQPNAEVVYRTVHGELYIAYEVSMLAPEVKRTVEQKKHGIQYKLDAESRLKIGSGGPEYRFQTLNGDIKIQRQ